MSLPHISAFENLAPRERVLVLLAGVLVLLFILWQFILSPVLDGRASANRALETAKRDYQIVSNGVHKLPAQNGGQTKTAFTQNDIIEAARRANITISRMQPSDDGAVEIWLDDSPTLSIYSFLSDFDTRFNARTMKAQMTRREDGTVAAQFIFSPV